MIMFPGVYINPTWIHLQITGMCTRFCFSSSGSQTVSLWVSWGCCIKTNILLMEEIRNNHLGCAKPYINERIFTISTGAGFLASTVWWGFKQHHPRPNWKFWADLCWSLFRNLWERLIFSPSKSNGIRLLMLFWVTKSSHSVAAKLIMVIVFNGWF